MLSLEELRKKMRDDGKCAALKSKVTWSKVIATRCGHARETIEQQAG